MRQRLGLSARKLRRDRAYADQAYLRYVRPSPRRERHELLVAHSNLIRYFVVRALGGRNTSAWARLDIRQCAISTIAVKPDGTTLLVRHNDAAHIPLDQQTFL